jgi:hypothetical protein
MQKVAQALGERDHPLPHRHFGEHVIDEVRGRLGLRRVVHEGQMPRPLQENATRKSWPQPVQRARAKPCTGMPQVRYPRSSRSM